MKSHSLPSSNLAHVQPPLDSSPDVHLHNDDMFKFDHIGLGDNLFQAGDWLTSTDFE